MPEMRRDDPQALDDWLGELSDEDWNEGAAELAGQSRAPHTAQPRASGHPSHRRPVATEARSASLDRRWAVAALAGLVLLAIVGAAAALALTDDSDTPAQTTTASSTATTTAQTETETETQPTTTETTTTQTTTTESATAFVLPAGTKLQRGESTGESDLVVSTDPELIADLQRALASAGFDPGTPDGDFGLNTEAAVVAFQQANGLPPDGIVGPATAEALNDAVATG